jgi:hypothetical protein
MSKLNLVVLDVQKTGIKSHGPTDDSGAVRILMKICQDQPLAYFEQVPGLYIADLETGTIRKPVLKLEI